MVRAAYIFGIIFALAALAGIASSRAQTIGFGPYIQPQTVRPATNIIAVEGNSEASTCVNVTSALAAIYNRCGSFWMTFYTKGIVQFPPTLDFGVANTSSTQLLARLPTSIAGAQAGGASAFLLDNSIFSYDAATGISLATSIANGNAIVALLQQANMLIFWAQEMPRGNTSYTSVAITGSQLNNLIAMSTWETQEALTVPGFYTVPIWGIMEDHSSVANAALAYGQVNWTYDGLHKSALGAAAIAQPWTSILDTIYNGFGTPLIQAAEDLYSATWVHGNIENNPFLLGSGGTAGSTSVTGTIPQYWTITEYPGTSSTIAVVVSQTTDTTLGYTRNFTKLAISGTCGSTNDHVDVYQDVNVGTNGVTVGSPYVSSSAIKVDSGQTGLLDVNSQLQGGSTIFAYAGIHEAITDPAMTASALDGVIVTFSPSGGLPTGSTSLRYRPLSVTCVPSATVSANVYVGAASAREGTSISIVP